ncbi:hypothetical protein ACH5RR_014103 [Cinchona calisaya]|uniref:AB hydrolase-1 domain-containing protein n=1 Tax=Cinchona calisaya TaxID=153742 RepID=A0ABD3A4A3_9GENT
MEGEKQQKHFVLVHGACHGAWSWYKLKPLLESAGHRVTALDLSASGIDVKNLQDLHTLHDYTLPLLEFMASIPPHEKVILVGHSLGGLNIALAADKYPNKVLVAVFLTAFMPDSVHAPSYPLDKYVERTPEEAWLDTEFKPYGCPEEPRTSMFFGPKFLTNKLYQLSSAEDLELAKLLVRPSSLFLEDLQKAKPFSKEGYGSVEKAYIICGEDKAIPQEFQHWLVENNGLSIVKVIKDADHMAMLSEAQKLCQSLQQIADHYTSLVPFN